MRKRNAYLVKEKRKLLRNKMRTRSKACIENGFKMDD